MYKKIAIAAISLALLGLAGYFLWPSAVHTQATIKGQTFDMEVVSSDESRQLGLSGRDKLSEGQGMLFVFSESGKYAFWMKGMLFPIDIIYVEKNKIVDMALNMPVPKDGETPATFVPHEVADRVMEFRAGTAERYGWKKGDEVAIPGY